LWPAGDKTVKVWRVEDGALEITLGGENGHKEGISDVAWSHDALLLASCSDDRTIKVWDRATVRSPRPPPTTLHALSTL
jgi:COMPASS component SWD3